MSLLTQQTNANTTETYFLKVNAKVANISTINANTISANTISTNMLSAYEGVFSTFSTAQIDLDGQLLTADANDLLLNGIPIATLSSLSSIADWAIEPAISTVDMAGNNLLNASTISCQTIVAGQGVIAANLQVENGLFKNLVAFNSLFVSSNTSTISSLVLNAELGNFSTLEAGVISTGAIVADTISAPSIFVSSINGAEFTSTSITVEVGSFSSLVANSLSSVGAQIREALISTIVFSPSLNPSLGGVDVNLGLGGILGNVVGWGAGVLGAATGIVALGTSAAALANGRQTNYIDATRYELVNGVTQLQFSTLDVPFSTIYRFNNSADPERTPGEEVFISTINPPGVAVRSVSDPLNTLSSPSSTIQAFGQWVPLPPEVVNVSTIADLFVSSLVVSTLSGFDDRIMVKFSTIIDGGAVGPDTGGSKLEQFQEVNSYNVFTDQIGAYFLSAIEVTNDMKFTSGTGISTNFLNCSGRAAVSSLSTATLEGAASNLFGLGVQGLVIQTEPAGQVYISTSQTNVTGLLNTSTTTATNLQGRNGGISSLGVSSLTASTITAGSGSFSGASVSSLAFSQAGAYGLSSLMSLSTSMIPGTGTSTTTYLNTDLSLGLNDIYCNQVRVGYGQGGSGAPAEVIFYPPNNSDTKGLNVANADRTIRIQSTVNSGAAGYLLDTFINPPLFSTINGQVNLVALFPSTNSASIGYSTLSKMNPVTQYGRSTLAGGTLTVVFSPAYADSNEYSVLLTYKDSAGGAPLHANILSISSFSANGSATNDFFWTTIGRV